MCVLLFAICIILYILYIAKPIEYNYIIFSIGLVLFTAGIINVSTSTTEAILEGETTLLAWNMNEWLVLANVLLVNGHDIILSLLNDL